MSYPTTLKLFKAWAKAMEEGAKVDKPLYTTSSQRPARKTRRSRNARARRLKRKRKKEG